MSHLVQQEKSSLAIGMEKSRKNQIYKNIPHATSFIAPVVVIFNSSRQSQRKKRSFKSRGAEVKGDKAKVLSGVPW